LEVAQFHRPDECLEGEAAAIAATGTVRIRFGDDHASVPKVLGYPVINVILPRRPTAVIRVGAIEWESRDYFEHVRIESPFGVVRHKVFRAHRLWARALSTGEKPRSSTG